jgi:long-chain fatty acid transport protein
MIVGRFLTFFSALGAISSAYAGGVMVQDVNNLYAQAHAGRAAVIDASSIYVNPAAMGFLKKHEAVLQACYIHPRVKFSNVALTNTPAGVLNGGNGGDSTLKVVLPSIYGVYNATPNWKFGIAAVEPFGLSNKYKDNWDGRYTALKSAFLSINVNPCVAYRCNNFAVGVGVSLQRTNLVFSKKVNIDASSVGGTQSNNAMTKVRGKNFAWGANLGLLWEACANLRFGLAYRSRIKHDIKGNIRFEVLPNFGTATATEAIFTAGQIKTNVTTPDIVNLSAAYDINKCWTVLADLMFTRWNVFDKIEIRQNTTTSAFTTETLDWRNTWMPSIGVNYRPNSCWVLRAGTAFDQTPTRDKYRSARIPDQNRIWAACGADYNYNDCVSFRLGYAHIFVKNGKVDNTVQAQPLLPGSRFQGTYKASFDMVGLQMNVKL